IQTVETNSLDLRYSGLRLKDRRREQVLLASILEQGILDPLYVIKRPDAETCVLLDGFKRVRCAEKLGLTEVPAVSLASNEAMGILKLIRLSTSKGMSALEEAALVDELHQRHGLRTEEISRKLERSVSWVSVRLGMLSEMSTEVREKIFSGAFPVRSYMYTLRPFTRVKSLSAGKEVESFVKRVSGRRYSTRDIDLLAGAWFKGGKMLKEQMREGNLDWTLRQLKERGAGPAPTGNSMNENESNAISNLEIIRACIFRFRRGLKEMKTGSDEFFELGRKRAGKLMDTLDDFKTTLREFYDRCGQKTGCADFVQVGKG
ncbi:ParB/RepB/Spo0J family partition protein, partial [Fibrobacterota bacterium]